MISFALCKIAKEQKRTDAGVITFAMTTKDVDRDGDVIEPKGAVLNHFLSNPVFLWAHDHRRPPIGRVMPETITISDDKVLADVKFDLNDPFAKMVYEKYKAGFLNAGSIRFRPLEYEPIQETETDENGNERVLRQTGWHIKKWELLEFSAVPIPANPMALAQKSDGGLDVVEAEVAYQVSGVLGKDSSEIDGYELYKGWVKSFAGEEVAEPVVDATAADSADDSVGAIDDTITELQNKLDELSQSIQAIAQTISEMADELKSLVEGLPLAAGDDSGDGDSDSAVAKGAVPFKNTPKANESRGWDKTAAINRIRKWASSDGSGNKDTIDWAKYRQAFAWYDSANPKDFGSYKLPHHDIENGQLVVVWAGVRAAMAALMGARGGVNIPDSDRKAVYNHLSGHYKQFDKTPPDFKELELLDGHEDMVVDILLNNPDFQEQLIERVLELINEGGN